MDSCCIIKRFSFLQKSFLAGYSFITGNKLAELLEQPPPVYLPPFLSCLFCFRFPFSSLFYFSPFVFCTLFLLPAFHAYLYIYFVIFPSSVYSSFSVSLLFSCTLQPLRFFLMSCLILSLPFLDSCFMFFIYLFSYLFRVILRSSVEVF